MSDLCNLSDDLNDLSSENWDLRRLWLCFLDIIDLFSNNSDLVMKGNNLLVDSVNDSSLNWGNSVWSWESDSVYNSLDVVNCSSDFNNSSSENANSSDNSWSLRSWKSINLVSQVSNLMSDMGDLLSQDGDSLGESSHNRFQISRNWSLWSDWLFWLIIITSMSWRSGDLFDDVDAMSESTSSLVATSSHFFTLLSGIIILWG